MVYKKTPLLCLLSIIASGLDIFIHRNVVCQCESRCYVCIKKRVFNSIILDALEGTYCMADAGSPARSGFQLRNDLSLELCRAAV